MSGTRVELRGGHTMPVLGLGTWQAKPEVVEEAVKWALVAGYRLIDTAFNYGNEEAIGRAIKTWIAQGGDRKELFITTKLPNFGNRPGDVDKYLSESLKRLGLEYIDLYLVHHPFGFLEPPSGTSPPLLDLDTNHAAVWQEMENAINSGRVRNIGLSNFNARQLEKVVSGATIPPANLQVELHAFLQQPELLETCKRLGVTVTAYAPLGSPGAKAHFKDKYGFQSNEVPDSLSDPKTTQIAQKIGKTPAQVLLRFLMQLGIAVVPKSASEIRITENIQALTVELSEEDMNALRSLDRGENGRLFDFLFYEGVEQHPEYPFPKRNEGGT